MQNIRIRQDYALGKHLRATLTSANLYLYSKKQFRWGMLQGTQFKENLKIPMSTEVNFYQETGIFNINLKTFYVFNFQTIKEASKTVI